MNQSNIGKHKIVISIPAYNEANNILKALVAMKKSIQYASLSDYILVVCINGCTDNTESIVNSFIRENPDINCAIIESEIGMVVAQRKINKIYKSDIFIMSGADSLVDEKSLKLLINALDNDPSLIAVYAKIKSITKEDGYRFFAKMGMHKPRKYIHGRLSAVRDWYIPSNEELSESINKSKKTKKLFKYGGIAVDDIFLSHYIMDKYGVDSIKQIDGAFCYAWPVLTFSDFYKYYRRSKIELVKIHTWFPEYNYLLKYQNRRTDWGKWWQSNLKSKTIWIIFLSIKFLLFVYLQLEIILLRFSWYKPKKQWQTVVSTKLKS